MNEDQKKVLAENLSGMVAGFIIGFERYSGVCCDDVKVDITIDHGFVEIDVGGVVAPDIRICEFKAAMDEMGVLENSDIMVNEMIMSEGINCEKH